MDEHKNFKKPKRRPNSIDGIVSDGRELGMPVHHSYRPNQGKPTPTLDQFVRRDDGFHALRQSPHALGQSPEAVETDALLDEPIVLDEELSKRPQKRHYFGHKRPRLRKVLKRTSLTLLVLILAGGAYLGIKFYITQKHLFRGGGQAPAICDGDVPVDQLNTEGDSRVNILMLGNGGPEHKDGPDLTDTVLLASIDPINKKAVLLSIPRDLWVRIPGNGAHKLNEAYFHGKQGSNSDNLAGKQKDGIAVADATLEKVVGVPIHYHVLVDFSAFRQAVDSVGGIDVNVPKELTVRETLWDEFTKRHYTLNVATGQQHFDGQRALFFARSRYTSTRGDFDRSERQRLILVALKEKILSLGTFSNPVRISQLLDSFGNNVYTDFDTASIKCLHKEISQIPSSNISSLDLVTPPHDLLAGGSAVQGGVSISVQRPKAGLFDYDDLQTYIHSVLRDGFLTKENAKVAVYNATATDGLGSSKATELKSYGYNVTTVSSVQPSTNPSQTVIVDLSKKGSSKYTKHYLERRFSTTVQKSLPKGLNITPPEGTSFVIILGQDAVTSR